MTNQQRKFLRDAPPHGWSPSVLTGSEMAMARRLEALGMLERKFIQGEGEHLFPTLAACEHVGFPMKAVPAHVVVMAL